MEQYRVLLLFALCIKVVTGDALTTTKLECEIGNTSAHLPDNILAYADYSTNSSEEASAVRKRFTGHGRKLACYLYSNKATSCIQCYLKLGQMSKWLSILALTKKHLLCVSDLQAMAGNWRVTCTQIRQHHVYNVI
jgi:hypothetical protein